MRLWLVSETSVYDITRLIAVEPSVSSNDRYRDCPFHLLLLNGCGFCRFPNSPAAPDSEIRAARNGQSCAKYAPSAFTDEVNCIVDNEKQKAVLVVGVRSARACVTMPSAASQ
jgi:hypothetical protein